MTVSSQINRISAVGAGAVLAIPYTFPTTASGDLTVIQRVISTGVETELDETTDYTATYSETGGTVTTVGVIANTDQVHVIRNTPMTQLLDLEQGGSFNAENVEDALDKNTKLSIENSDSLERTLIFPATDPTSSFDDMPNSIDRASKNLTFDSDGKPTASVVIEEGDVTFTDFGTDMAEAANADTARGLVELDTDDDVEFAGITGTTGTFSGAISGTTGTFTDIITKGPLIDVRAYGAVGDDIADDTAEIQAALTAGAGKTVFIPEGTFKTTATLNVPPLTCIIGCGYNSILKPTGCDGLSFDNSNGVSPTIISNFWIYGPGGGNTYKAIKVMGGLSTAQKVTGITFDNIYISWFGTAMYFRSLWSSRIYGCYLVNNWNGIQFVGQNVGNRVVSSDIVLGTATGAGESTGIYIGSASDYDPGGTTEHRPEDITIDKTLVYGFAVGINLVNNLLSKVIVCDLDAISLTGIRYTSKEGGLTIRDNWINITGAGALYGINGVAMAVATADVCLISHNHITATTPHATSKGIYIMSQNDSPIIEYNYVKGFGTYDILLDDVDNGRILHNSCLTPAITAIQSINNADATAPNIISGNICVGIYTLQNAYIRNDVLVGSDTWDAASIADGDEEAKDVTVTGAVLGDFAMASFSLDVADLVLTAQVTVADTVTVSLANNTGGAIDLASGTVYVRVLKK